VADQIPGVSGRLVQALSRADATDAERIDAARRLMAIADSKDSVAAILGQVGTLTPPPLANGLIGTLGTSRIPETASVILARWPELSPASRRTAAALLLRRKSWADALLAAVETGTLAAGDIRLGLGDAGTTLKLEGDLGALAVQPFAGPLSIVTGGQYRATADRAQGGEINVSLQVSEVGLRQSEGRIRSAAVAAKYVPAADGLRAEGSFKMQATHLSSGKFTLTQATTGAKTDWQAVVAIDNVDVDDFLALLPKTEETPAAPSTTPKPDRAPFWANQSGALQLTIGTARAYGISAEKVVLRAEAEDKAIRLTQLSGKLADGALSGRGQLSFLPTISNGPYSLSATVALNQFEFGEVAQAFPAAKDFLAGRADATAALTSVCGTPGELAAKLQVDAQLTSKGGRIRAFGDKKSSLAASADKAGDVGEVLGGLAMLWADRRWPRDAAPGFDELEVITLPQALRIGIFQCVSLIPGTSRSMSMLIGGRACGLSHAAAAEFSFLVGFLTLSAASLYKAWSLGPALAVVYPAGPGLLGLLVAFVVAFATVRWLVGHLQRKGFVVFAWYRIALGGAMLAFLSLRFLR